MKHSKRKRKNAPAATSVAQPVASVANAADGAIQKAGSTKTAGFAPSKADYTLSANCTIQESAALKSALLALEDTAQSVMLDVHAVERVDTAALQLLCAFVRERRTHGRRTEWTGNVSTFSEAVEILGLSQALGFAAEKSA